MRYGKAIRGNRQRVGRTTNKCFFKKDEVFKKEEPVPPPPPPTVQIDGGGPGGVGMGDWTNQNPIIFTFTINEPTNNFKIDDIISKNNSFNRRGNHWTI